MIIKFFISYNFVKIYHIRFLTAESEDNISYKHKKTTEKAAPYRNGFFCKGAPKRYALFCHKKRKIGQMPDMFNDIRLRRMIYRAVARYDIFAVANMI